MSVLLSLPFALVCIRLPAPLPERDIMEHVMMPHSLHRLIIDEVNKNERTNRGYWICFASATVYVCVSVSTHLLFPSTLFFLKFFFVIIVIIILVSALFLVDFFRRDDGISHWRCGCQLRKEIQMRCNEKPSIHSFTKNS